MTAWETYVEDRSLEACAERLSGVTNSSIAEFVEAKLAEEIKKPHNPDSHKTIRLFRDYAGVDLTNNWCWNNYAAKTVRETLNRAICV